MQLVVQIEFLPNDNGLISSFDISGGHPPSLPHPRRLCSIRLKQRCRCFSTTGEIVAASSYVFLVLFTCPSHRLRDFFFFFLGACFICTSPGNVTLQRNSQLEPCVCHIAENDWISEKAAVKKMWSSICRHQSLFFFASKQTQLQPCGAFLHCFSARKKWAYTIPEQRCCTSDRPSIPPALPVHGRGGLCYPRSAGPRPRELGQCSGVAPRKGGVAEGGTGESGWEVGGEGVARAGLLPMGAGQGWAEPGARVSVGRRLFLGAFLGPPPGHASGVQGYMVSARQVHLPRYLLLPLMPAPLPSPAPSAPYGNDLLPPD